MTLGLPGCLLHVSALAHLGLALVALGLGQSHSRAASLPHTVQVGDVWAPTAGLRVNALEVGRELHMT